MTQTGKLVGRLVRPPVRRSAPHQEKTAKKRRQRTGAMVMEEAMVVMEGAMVVMEDIVAMGGKGPLLAYQSHPSYPNGRDFCSHK